jgi:hypothetical protein
MRTRNARNQEQLAAAVNRVLGKRQVTAYKKMLGEPFDVSQVRGGPGQRPWNRPAGPNPANRSGVDAARGPGPGGNAGTAPAGTSADPNARGSTAKAKRKSLRELRGLDD